MSFVRIDARIGRHLFLALAILIILFILLRTALGVFSLLMMVLLIARAGRSDGSTVAPIRALILPRRCARVINFERVRLCALVAVLAQLGR